ncbi:TPA_exp: hypothetical protein A8136_3648 [Trichophyton benhamiae CBS 112371]|nr:TPA_exp: hypothetical protein A8136_3648 [Trichophyton benhamiae CBS 112371]
MTGKSKLSRKQKNAEGFIERKQKKFNKLKQDKLSSDSTPNTARGDIDSNPDPNVIAGLVWYPNYYDPAWNPLPYYQMTEYPMINHSHPQWLGTPNRPGTHETGAWGWNRSQNAHHENEPDQSPRANEPSRLRGDAPEFIPAYEQEHEAKGCEDGLPMTSPDESHSR